MLSDLTWQNLLPTCRQVVEGQVAWEEFEARVSDLLPKLADELGEPWVSRARCALEATRAVVADRDRDANTWAAAVVQAVALWNDVTADTIAFKVGSFDGDRALLRDIRVRNEEMRLELTPIHDLLAFLRTGNWPSLDPEVCVNFPLDDEAGGRMAVLRMARRGLGELGDLSPRMDRSHFWLQRKDDWRKMECLAWDFAAQRREGRPDAEVVWWLEAHRGWERPEYTPWPQRPLGGESAGAAFAMALSCVLQQEEPRPDRTWAISARLADTKGNLAGVAGEKNKADACARCHLNLVVYRADVDKFRRAAGGRFHVEGAHTVEQAWDIATGLVREVLAYLSQLADVLDQTHWMRRGEGGERISIRASDIAVEPMVLTKQERPRPPRAEREAEERESMVERRSPMDEIEAQRYELPLRAEERQEERWRQVVRSGRVRLGLKGAPGSGKTFITRQTLASLARDSAAKLERQEANLEEVEIPIWVTAKALAGASAREVSEALPEALENTFPQVRLAPHFRSWLRQAAGSPRAFIVVDALDELLGKDRTDFQAKAAQLEDLRVIVTCRTMQWEERKGWLGWGRVVEVELAPFKRRQKRDFVRKFFGENSEPARSMERLLQVNFALRHACTTPLLLTFGCLLHEEGRVNEGTTHALLYAHILRQMVSGEWAGCPALLGRQHGAGGTVSALSGRHRLGIVFQGASSQSLHLARLGTSRSSLIPHPSSRPRGFSRRIRAGRLHRARRL